MRQLPVAQPSKADFDQLIDLASARRCVQDASVQGSANTHYKLDRSFLERNLVNSDSFIPSAKALESVIRAQMFAEARP